MAAAFGFVYLLSHPDMPSVYKIGFTDRAPHARAAELSASTSVPRPFDVVCYIEIEDALEVERALHRIWTEFRINPSREFFSVPGTSLQRLLGYYRFHPNALAYSGTGTSQLLHEYGWTQDDIENPWEEPPGRLDDEADEIGGAPQIRVVGGTSAGAL